MFRVAFNRLGAAQPSGGVLQGLKASGGFKAAFREVLSMPPPMTLVYSVSSQPSGALLL